MNQLWQSLAITIVLGGASLLVASFFIRAEEAPKTVPLSTASSTPVTSINTEAFSNINLSGQAAIIIDLTTGETLYAENADTQLPLASLTKLLTIYAALKELSPSSLVTISSSSLAVEGESGLYEGEQFVFTDLARFALVSSSNDAAAAITEAAAASRGSDARSMLTGAAASVGLVSTYANNGTGLDENEVVSGGYGTARDIAKLARALLEEAPSIASASIEPSITIYSAAGAPHTLPNTNPEVLSVSGILLSKTGFTDLAGGNLAVVFDTGIGHPVAAVVLGSSRTGRFSDVDILMSASRQYFAGTPQ